MKKFFLDLKDFLKNVSHDQRIPDRDRKVIIGLLVLVFSPIDLIPDWIPILGLLDDFLILAIILDYFFVTLDHNILLSHYPWGMKSFAELRKVARFVSMFVPTFLKNKIWQYKKDVY